MKCAVVRKLCLVAGISLAFGGTQFAHPAPPSSTLHQAAPDNTRTNKDDDRSDAITADRQKMNPEDRNLTQKIRAEIIKDKSLSTYARNIKIVTRDGKVSLKGPVRSEEEKSNVEGKARAIAGDENVKSEIEIARPKS